jgi:HK97 family phage prohead protease
MAVTEMSGEFDLTMPLAKVWEDAAGELRFEGVASSTRLDRQQERMTANAIRKMAAQSGLDLLPSHRAGALEELGVVEEAWVDNESFRVAGRLDRSNPQAQRLFDQVTGGRRYGLSVGGRVTKEFWKWDEEAGRQVRHIDDVELDHVAVCRPEAAANPDTYLRTLAKAAEAVIGEEMPDDEATLARVGRAAIEAARSLWPFAKGEADTGPEETTEEAYAAAEEMAALRKEVAEALEEVRAAIDGLRKSEAAAEEGRPAADHGRSQGIAGQEGVSKSDPWAGVI